MPSAVAATLADLAAALTRLDVRWYLCGAQALHHDGLVYSTDGVVIDPTIPLVLGTLPSAFGPVAADSTFAEAYFASSSSLIAATTRRHSPTSGTLP
jgi:hypothetical protein